MRKNNMAYGTRGFSVDNAMMNASMDKTAKQNSLGVAIISPQSTGFADKEQLERDRYKILYRRSENIEGCMTLKDNLESKTDFRPVKGTKKIKGTTVAEIQGVLFNEFIDVMLFGTTFTLGGEWGSFGITGALQIGFGINKFQDTEEKTSNMLPCFSNPNAKKEEPKKETEQSVDNEGEPTKLKTNTLGEQIVLDRANFVQDWTLCPYQYDKYIDVIEGFEGFTEEAYQAFKKASLKSVSNQNTKAKKGCQNEFSLIVEMKDEVRDSINLNCLGDYITVDRIDDKTVYDLTDVMELLNEVKEEIKSVEIYFDVKKLKLIGDLSIAKLFSIRTLREVKNYESN